MSIRVHVTCFVLLSTSAWLAAQSAPQQHDQSQGQIGYKSSIDAEKKKTLLLKDFHPVPMLHASAHKVDQAKFYVIDVPDHVNDAGESTTTWPPNAWSKS